MSTLTCTAIHKRFGDVEVLKGIDLQAAEGELLVLLGPSGCGKSTLLRVIAGLEAQDSGTVAIDDDVISDVHPRDRNIAMVFQNYALYPLMSVRENLAFGMRINSVAPAQIESKVAQAAQILGIEELLDRRPAQLSGGQRQRVAMGRAMVRDPRLFLFDEPLSNLDAKLRDRMRGELKSLHQQIGATTVYVTHDQKEAMTMADRLVVMREGRIEQAGVPTEVYDRPASQYIASFLGSPEINLFAGDIGADGACTAYGCQLPLSRAAAPGPVVYGVRPHHVKLCAQDAAGALSGQATLLEPTGDAVLVHVQFGAGGSLIAQVQEAPALSQHDPCAVQIDAAKVHLFDPHSGLAR